MFTREVFTRREFVRGAGALGARLAAPVPIPAVPDGPLRGMPSIRSTFGGVPVGCNTRSLLNLPLEDAIRTMADIGYGMAELHPGHVEPAGLRRVAPDDELRAGLRDWRLGAPLEHFEEIGRRFRDAGLFLYAYNLDWRDGAGDAEIDRGFAMTRALGCRVLSAVGSRRLLARLDPFAERHGIWVGAHNEPRYLPRSADLDELLVGRSGYMGLTLDVGHLVASGSDPAAFLKARHDRIIDLHIKDRRRAGGPDVRFGEGDTPVAEILRINRDGGYHIPANVEWEVRDSDPGASLRTCLEYCRRALETPP